MNEKEALRNKIANIERQLMEAARLSQKIVQEEPDFRGVNVRIKNMASESKIISHKIKMSSGGGWI